MDGGRFELAMESTAIGLDSLNSSSGIIVVNEKLIFKITYLKYLTYHFGHVP